MRAEEAGVTQTASTRRGSGAQVVYDTLRRRIHDGELAPGERLHETELAASLSVSRTPLREALRMLLAEGLVHQLPTGGMVVAPLDPDDMRELYVVRAALEGVVAREACDRLTDEDFGELRGLVDQMQLLVEYPREVHRLGTIFHGRILEASRNRRAAQLLEQLRGHLLRYQAISTRGQTRRHDAVTEHRHILDALVLRDADAAERLMRAHVLAAYTEGLADASLEA
jgi:DNA-binding GntR family transcriptional regulator